MTEAQLRSKAVSILTAWLGLKEADGSHQKILDIYNSHKPLPRGVKMLPSYAWCAATVSAVFIEAGLTDIGFVECSCGRMIDLYKKAGRWKETDSFTPSPGDLIMYDWDDKGTGDNTNAPEHVGMVVSVTGSNIKVIEGNKGDAVACRNIKVNGKYIRGYCLPDYASKATTKKEVIEVELPVLKKGAKGDTVKALQHLLIGYGFPCGKTGADGSFGGATLIAVRDFQKDRGLAVDGSVGAKTWNKLLNG